MSRVVAIASVVALLAACSREGEAAAPPAIALTGRVVDQADVLSPATERVLNQQLSELEKTTSDQLVVVTTSSLGGRTIEDYSLALGRSWKIGRADIDNGVVLLIAPNERRLRVEVGNGLEALLTDQRAAAAVRVMSSDLQNGGYDAAVTAGVADIVSVLKSDRRRPQYRNEVRRKMAA